MASARGNNKDGLSEYELEREARIARNKRRLEALKIPSMSIEVAKGPSRKKTKVCGTDCSFCSRIWYSIEIYTILFLSCRELITKVMHK